MPKLPGSVPLLRGCPWGHLLFLQRIPSSCAALPEALCATGASMDSCRGAALLHPRGLKLPVLSVCGFTPARVVAASGGLLRGCPRGSLFGCLFAPPLAVAGTSAVLSSDTNTHAPMKRNSLIYGTLHFSAIHRKFVARQAMRRQAGRERYRQAAWRCPVLW